MALFKIKSLDLSVLIFTEKVIVLQQICPPYATQIQDFVWRNHVPKNFSTTLQTEICQACLLIVLIFIFRMRKSLANFLSVLFFGGVCSRFFFKLLFFSDGLWLEIIMHLLFFPLFFFFFFFFRSKSFKMMYFSSEKLDLVKYFRPKKLFSFILVVFADKVDLGKIQLLTEIR